MARRCGAKHIFKSNCPKDCIGGPIFEVPMFKNGTPLWHQAHLSVKMYKTRRARTNFGRSDVQKWHTAVVRSAFASQNVKKIEGFGAILEVTMSKNVTQLRRGAHLRVKTYKTRIFGPLFEVQMSQN